MNIPVVLVYIMLESVHGFQNDLLYSNIIPDAIRRNHNPLYTPGRAHRSVQSDAVMKLRRLWLSRGFWPLSPKSVNPDRN
ncbi:hypothetical protein T492DRAFT_929229 [Pavlovales sp. CCMP2436]|nr:hypothetical protein T492DRAFT_929229 [Pavlovales sp. CCMP2436]